MSLIVHKRRFRIVTKDGKIKFAGTGEDSWFNSFDEAVKKTDYKKDEAVYEYDYNGNKLWEIL